MEGMNSSKPFSGQDSEDETDHESKYNIVTFDKSLQELRDLRSQLHYAADYHESTFLKTQEGKKVVMETTKEYLCRAVVTVVDHLGCLSSNLNGLISKTNAFSEADLRINCLKQRAFLCHQYAEKLALSRVQLREILPRHNARFLSTCNPSMPLDAGKCNEDLRVPETRYSPEINSALVPVRDGLSILSRGPNNPTFHFQESREKRRLNKSGQVHEILSLIRRAKRTA